MNYDFADLIGDLEHLPILKYIIKLLKKIGFFKDYERLYKTENKIKALGNSFKQIEVPFEKILQKNKIEIPCLILLRQKDNNILTNNKLIKAGFKMSARTMGMYVLPPLKVIEYDIKDRISIEKFLVQKFGLSQQSKINIRFCVLLDLNKQYFSFRHTSIINKETKPLFELIQNDIIKYLGTTKSLRYVKQYYKKEWKKKEAEIIESTPLQHISLQFLNEELFNIIAEKEQDILNYMKDKNYIKDNSFLSLSKISKGHLKEVLTKFLGDIENVEELCQKIIEQAEFMANKL